MLITITCSLRSVNSSNIVSNFINFQTRWNAAITLFLGAAANATTTTTTTTMTKKNCKSFYDATTTLLLTGVLVFLLGGVCAASIVSSIVSITHTHSQIIFSWFVRLEALSLATTKTSKTIKTRPWDLEFVHAVVNMCVFECARLWEFIKLTLIWI